jgi:hypothetical protein
VWLAYAIVKIGVVSIPEIMFLGATEIGEVSIPKTRHIKALFNTTEFDN